MACVLLVAFHVIGHDASRGLRVADDSAWRWMADGMVFLLLPLFTFLAGLVFAARSHRTHQAWTFLQGKFLRLVVPWVLVGLLYRVMNLLLFKRPVSFNPIDVLLFPYEHLWYLQALFVILVLAFALDVVGLLRRPLFGGSVLAVWVLLAERMAVPTEFFSLDGACFLFPYFLLGVLVAEHAASWQRHARWVVGSALALAVFAAALWAMGMVSGPVGVPHARTPVGVALLLVLLIVLWLRMPVLKPLVVLGPHAFSIYLFHVIGLAAARMALQRLGVEQPLVLFAGGLAGGLLLPILLDLAWSRLSRIRGPQPRRGVGAGATESSSAGWQQRGERQGGGAA